MIKWRILNMYQEIQKLCLAQLIQQLKQCNTYMTKEKCEVQYRTIDSKTKTINECKWNNGKCGLAGNPGSPATPPIYKI